MMTALADPTIRLLTLADGTYSVSTLYVDASVSAGFARTAANSVVLRAATDGGVTFDGGAGRGPLIWFRGGTAYQEWRGFKFGNCQPWDNGVIGIGEGSGAPNHHLTLRQIEFLSTIQTGPGPNGNYTNGQGIYLSWANSPGNHDLLIDGWISNAELWSHLHIYHDSPTVGYDNTVRNATLNCVGTHGQMGIVPWASTMTNFLFEDILITGANEYGVRHAAGGTATLRRVTTTGSGTAGFFSSLGTYPNVPGLTFESCSFA